MLTENAVINASPFILLCKTDLIDIVPGLFKKVLMPAAVAEEIVRGADPAAERLPELEENWLLRRMVETDRDVLVWNLVEGESEVLSLALTDPGHHTALIDDRAARNCAETLGLKTVGTVGLLIHAKKQGLLAGVADELDKLREEGLWLSEEIYTTALKLAGEL